MEVIMYSTHCPRCAVLEAKLKQKGIQYKEIDNEDEMSKLNIMSVPVLKVDNQLLGFTNAVKWVNEQ